MEHEDLGARYKRLKQDLAKAYASSTWDSPYIDRLAKELYEIESLPRFRDTST